ncbi:MAG: hypothetical protein Q4F67_15735 [Propionibacteriaceae bacterium]|nr:hypothetical protein [Propionibacteriaceae bacterium]
MSEAPTMLFVALTSVAARQTVNNAHFLLEHQVPVAILTAEPMPFHELELDERVQLIDLTREEVASVLHRGKRQLVRLRSLGLPGRAVNAAGHQAYKIARPLVLWRAAEKTLSRHLSMAQVAQVVLADAHAVPLGWHLGRAHPDLSIVFSLDRSAYAEPAPERPESSQV